MHPCDVAFALGAFAALCAAETAISAGTCRPDADCPTQPSATSLLQIRKGAVRTGSSRHSCRAVGAAYEHVGRLLDRHEELSGQLQLGGHHVGSAARDAHGFVRAAIAELREHSEALGDAIAGGDCAELGSSLLELDRRSRRLREGLDRLGSLEGLADPPEPERGRRAVPTAGTAAEASAAGHVFLFGNVYPRDPPGAKDRADPSSTGQGCCFKVGYGELNKPFSLQTEVKGKDDCRAEEDTMADLGGAWSWSQDCPEDADKANELIQAQKKVREVDANTSTIMTLAKSPPSILDNVEMDR